MSYEDRCTDACKAERAKYKALGASWRKAWPNACEDCDGIAIMGHYYEYDTGYSEARYCDCIEVRGECPRCAKPLVEDELRCEHCGASYDHAKGEVTTGMPVYAPDYEGEPCCEPQVEYLRKLDEEAEDYFKDDLPF